MRAAILRLSMTACYHAVRAVQRITGRRPFGVHGVVFTPGGEVVLVRLTYAPGWQLPGGGCKRGEGAEDGLLRELREEIGLRAWSSVEPLGRPAPTARGAIFVVRDAVYRPCWSLEIAEVRSFAREGLPEGIASWTSAALARAG